MFSNIENQKPKQSHLSEVLCYEAFGHILSFLGRRELAQSEKVSKTWKNHISESGAWKSLSQNLLNLPPEIDPKKYLPVAPSYKESLSLLYLGIFDEQFYQRYIGSIGPIPQIPESISLKKWHEPDPCDPTKKIGEEYVWIYVPSDFVVDAEEIQEPSLKKNRTENSTSSDLNLREISSKQVTIPLTIRNIKKLFERPKAEYPSTYRYIWDKILAQHGDQKAVPGWICMRKDVIGRNLSEIQRQELVQELVAEKNVVIAELLPRILFSCLGYIRPETADTYPDALNPWTQARTATVVRDEEGNTWPLGCGGNPPGLRINRERSYLPNTATGVAVMLSTKV